MNTVYKKYKKETTEYSISQMRNLRKYLGKHSDSLEKLRRCKITMMRVLYIYETIVLTLTKFR